MRFEDKKQVRHTDAGTATVHGCKIQRGDVMWVVSYNGRVIADRETYCEAEAAARLHAATMAEAEAQREYDATEQQAEQQAEQCAAARYSGASVRGFDENGNVEVW